MSQTPRAQEPTLISLLKLYNLSEIAREMTARGFPMSRDRMARMAKGQSVPTVRELPAFAEVLRIDVIELTRMVASMAA